MQRNSGITGKTLVVPLVGHPIAQVKTPEPMNQWFGEHQMDVVVVPMDIRPEQIGGFFDVLRAMENSAGCTVTMPHKQAAFVAASEVSERARRAKSVNVIRRSPSGRLIGDMTDGIAMVAALQRRGIDVRGRNVLIVGAGGAGTAIAHAVAEEGAASLVVIERDQMRSKAIVGELGRYYPQMPVFDRAPPDWTIEIAVNASPVGMNPNDPLPYPVEELGDALIVADAVTSPPVTRWLTEAERRGLTIQRGEEMAFAQVPIQLQYLRLQAARPESQGRRRDERTGTVERGALG